MRHKWTPTEPKQDSALKVYSADTCVRCGMLREKLSPGYYYSRSGQQYGFDQLPECIDWEVENAKTID